MKTSNVGISLIKHFESFSSVAYFDGAGVCTIGYGTTRINDIPVKPGMVCTEAQALQWLAEDILKFEIHVRKLIPRLEDQNKFDALVSFVYNVGQGALQISTLRKKINAGLPVLEKNFTDWNKIRVNGVLQTSKGLIRRRKSEYVLFSENRLQFKF